MVTAAKPGALGTLRVWARRVKRDTGREPSGLGALRALLILFVYVPLAGVGALCMLAILGGLLARAFA